MLKFVYRGPHRPTHGLAMDDHFTAMILPAEPVYDRSRRFGSDGIPMLPMRPVEAIPDYAPVFTSPLDKTIRL